MIIKRIRKYVAVVLIVAAILALGAGRTAVSRGPENVAGGDYSSVNGRNSHKAGGFHSYGL